MQSKEPAIIVDIDGTLALFDREKVSPYRRDFLKDVPNKPVVELVNSMWTSTLVQGGYKILLTSGRLAEFQTDTQTWLRRSNVPYDLLLMRPMDDQKTPDTELKAKWYKEEIEPFYDVLFCVDDRPKVVRMWRSLGLTVMHVTGWDDDF